MSKEIKTYTKEQVEELCREAYQSGIKSTEAVYQEYLQISLSDLNNDLNTTLNENEWIKYNITNEKKKYYEIHFSDGDYAHSGFYTKEEVEKERYGSRYVHEISEETYKENIKEWGY